MPSRRSVSFASLRVHVSVYYLLSLSVCLSALDWLDSSHFDSSFFGPTYLLYRIAFVYIMPDCLTDCMYVCMYV